jgi:hypothetical protein
MAGTTENTVLLLLCACTLQLLQSHHFETGRYATIYIYIYMYGKGEETSWDRWADNIKMNLKGIRYEVMN